MSLTLIAVFVMGHSEVSRVSQLGPFCQIEPDAILSGLVPFVSRSAMFSAEGTCTHESTSVFSCISLTLRPANVL